MTDAAFEAQIGQTLDFEGGYANHPNDHGGETNFGISKAQYPRLDIKNLSRANAIAIYKRDYWNPYRYGELPEQMAKKTFDLCVNMGPIQANKLLQRAINAQLQGEHQLVDDGKIGPLTIAAAKIVDDGKVLNQLRKLAEQFYLNIVTHKPSQSVFLNGWLRRARA